MVYAGIGVVTLYFVYEPHRAWRRAMAVAVVAWTVTSAASHARLVDEYLNREPGGPHRVLANYLVEARHPIRACGLLDGVYHHLLYR